MSDLVARARSEGTPVVEGEEATFVWQGKERVQLIGDLTDWSEGTAIDLEAVASGVWARTLTFPRDAYLE